MMHGKFAFSAAGQTWMAWPTDVERNAVAVIDTTRREWFSRGSTLHAPDADEGDRAQFAHPAFRRARDAKNSRSGRARYPRPVPAPRDPAIRRPNRYPALAGDVESEEY